MLSSYQNKFSHKFLEYKHSKLAVLMIGMVVVSSLFVGGAALQSRKTQLHGSAPSPVVDAKLKEALKANIFADVPGTHENAYAIAYLKNLDLIRGYADGSFKPDTAITRAELMVFLINVLRLSPLGLRHSYCFDDVDREWFAPAVCFGKSKGWIADDDSNTFRPMENISKKEALSIVMAAFAMSSWENASEYQSDEQITRGELAQLFYEVMMVETPHF